MPLADIQSGGCLLSVLVADLDADSTEPIEVPVLCGCATKSAFEFAFDLSYLDSVDSACHIHMLHMLRAKHIHNDVHLLNIMDAIQWLNNGRIVRSYEDFVIVNRLHQSTEGEDSLFFRQVALRIPLKELQRRCARLTTCFQKPNTMSVGGWAALRQIALASGVSKYNVAVPALDLVNGWGFYYANKYIENAVQPALLEQLRRAVFAAGNMKAIQLCYFTPVATDDFVALACSCNPGVVPILREAPVASHARIMDASIIHGNLHAVRMFHEEFDRLSRCDDRGFWVVCNRAHSSTWDFITSLMTTTRADLLEKLYLSLDENLLMIVTVAGFNLFLNNNAERMAWVLERVDQARVDHIMDHFPVDPAVVGPFEVDPLLEPVLIGRRSRAFNELACLQLSRSALELMLRYRPALVFEVDWGEMLKLLILRFPRQDYEIIDFAIARIYNYSVPFALRLELQQGIARLPKDDKTLSVQMYKTYIGYINIELA